MTNLIQTYEHSRLELGGAFKEHHRKALLKLNELHSFNYMEATHRGVKFKNYVGIVQVDGLCIEILPKIDQVDADADQWKSVLVDMLRISGKIKATDANHADVQKKRYTLLEIYLDLFLREVEGLIRKGLCKQYRKNTFNTLALKGKLEMAGHIRHNLVHNERFYTTHQVYDYDHKLHQILSTALQIVVKLSTNSYLAAAAYRVALSFPEVERTVVSEQTFATIVYTRKTQGYQQAIALAQIIIENYSPTISTGTTNMIALLFNMNSLWEDYVYSILSRGQKDGKYTVSRASKTLLYGRSYNLQPDMFIELQGDDRRLIIDTKWKVPQQQKASMADLRQIYAYNRYWKASKGVLLYPGSRANSEWLQYKDDLEGLQTTCKIAYLDVLNSEGELDRDIDVLSSIDRTSID